MIFRLWGKEKTPLVKQVNQVHGLTRWICNYHFVGVGFERKSWQMFSVQSHMKVWEHQKKVICCSMEYDTVTIFFHIWHWNVCVVLDVFRLSQVLLFERYWKLTSGRSQPYLKSSNRNWQHFSNGYQDRNHVFPDTEDLGKLNKNQMHWWFCFHHNLA